MIPKVIHYCWFGKGDKPKLAQKCIDSWKQFMPDYKIIEWNETNFDVNYNAYTKMCYEQKKYAFLSDYLRLLLVEKNGGIYLDTDVEAIRSFDELLSCGSFFGFETDEYVNTGEGFGAEAHDVTVQKMLQEYDILLDANHGIIGCPRLNTDALQKLGLKLNGQQQTFNRTIVYPSDYFNPRNSVTGELKKTSNTFSIHWYSASWLPWHRRLRARLGKPIRRFLHKIKVWN